jgi:hypothetical protein
METSQVDGSDCQETSSESGNRRFVDTTDHKKQVSYDSRDDDETKLAV